MNRIFIATLFVLGAMFTACSPKTKTDNLSPEEARQIAKDAYIFSYPLLMGYQAQYYRSVPESPGYRAPLNEVSHDTEPADHTRIDVVTMNGDTPYSAFGLDLRAEPMVLSVSKIEDRYYVFQCIDLFTHNFAFIGTRTTGTEPGDFLFVGPGWEGDIPKEKFKAVFYSESQFISIIGRTQLKGNDDLPNVLEIQKSYKLQPLSVFEGKPAKPSLEVDWVPLDPKEFGDARFIKYVNFYLSMLEPFHEEDSAELERFEKIGIKPGAGFDSANYSPEVLSAINAGIKDGIDSIQQKATNIAKQVNGWNMMDAFGSRSFYKGDRLLRAAAVMVGIYANDKEEAFYPIAYVDADGEVLDGSKHQYRIDFTPANTPPAKYFWSVTMYNKQADGVAGYMVENPINRYLINSTTQGLVKDKDGNFSIYLQHEAPTDKGQLANWLPAPAEPFYLVLRIYGPEEPALNGTWQPPVINKVKE
ncbi:DUF1254 domain-containing protein [Aquiflexum gelatinilyticum]|uniref:DUF1254 domain-containing protein n=1 Tax=Aquiflexum gelatinilyticum TaxID=2961943 RepID=UPI00216768C8|nr:DUF1254 domain-containing protein [Aquiflexum gelatinilyticum]MCS4434206.1 DUF1254 domain-containing protein [Aquiflexum gelatinilyticum]